MLKLLFFLFFIVIVSSCHEKTENINKDLSLEAYSDLKVAKYSLDVDKIRSQILRLAFNDGVALPMDGRVIKYYKDNNPLIWVNRSGVYERADTFLCILKGIDYYGLRKKAFRVSEIENDINRIRDLKFSYPDTDINDVMARLEYNLTKAYFRYSAGQYFGFVNPDYLYNNLEKYEVDSTAMKYKQLCDLNVLKPDSKFYSKAVKAAFCDSVSEFLDDVVPHGVLLDAMLQLLHKSSSSSQRLKILCNIERCRWRMRGISHADAYRKYVIVNIPSFNLRAVDNGNVQTMNICCGEVKYKTPLLASWIKRMDVNPQWIVPKSISKSFLYNFSYMHRMGMYVLDKEKGKLPLEQVSYDKIMSNEQHIVQSGGRKNALGRIIFRFDNNFSVFLHDTSSPWLFKRSQRALSHGCVRVEKPFDLALFLLGERAEDMEDKLKYSMSVDFINDVDSMKKRNIDRKRLISTLRVTPQIPLYITYYTIYYNADGKLAEYDDVYGYDDVLIEKLSPFFE